MHLNHFDIILSANDVSAVNLTKIKDWSFVAKPYNNFRYGLTQNEAYNSSSSLYIISKLPTTDGFAAIKQKIAAKNYLNSKLKLTAFVKTANLNGSAVIELDLFDESDQVFRRGTVKIDSPTNQQDWQKVEIVADITANIKSISYAGYLLGSGQVWFDEFNLSNAVEHEIDTTIDMQQHQPSENLHTAERQKYLDIVGYKTLANRQLRSGKQPLDSSQWHISDHLINEYSFKLDDAALLLESKQSNADFGVFYRRSFITNDNAKAVKFSAKIKRQYVSSLASIWMRIEDQNKKNISFDNLGFSSSGGSSDWQPIEVVLPLKKEAKIISFGALLVGNGKMWLKEPHIDFLSSESEYDAKRLVRPSNLGFE
jgi:hypothetical protein